MFLKVILFILITISFIKNSYAQQPFCDGLDDNQKPKKIKQIVVKVNNYKSFQINAVKILTDISVNIKKEFKKNFKSKIIVKFEDNTICNFTGKIRQSGDFRGHIVFKDNIIKQSLDIKLTRGHINGITKFKLFLPGTRNDSEDELLLTEILRYLGFLSPRSYIVDTKINDVHTKMLLQEKTAKELLEFNKRREGPILEGNEIFQSKFLSKIKRQSTDMEEKLNKHLNNGAKIQLSKIINSNWSIRSKNNFHNSLNAISYLNKIYLLYAKSYKNSKYSYHHSNFTLNNKYLALENPKNQIYLDNYNLILIAFGATHGLIPKNRKFYWNSFEKFFEPIYYDGNINLNNKISVLNPITPNAIELIPDLKAKIENINPEVIYRKLITKGSDLSKEELISKLDIFKTNLSKLEKDFKLRLEEIEYNFLINLKPSDWNHFLSFFTNIYPDVRFVTYEKFKKKKNNLEFLNLNPCNKLLFDCEKKNYLLLEANKNKVKKILESDYELKNKVYQYLLLEENYDLKNKTFYEFKKIKIQDAFFYFENGIEYTYENNILNIFQKKNESRAFIIGNKINNLEINFFGINSNHEISNLNDYPSNKQSLTGCLSLINVELNEVNIFSSNSSCEDSVNLINVTGNINKIEIENSLMDGLDIDFSQLEINNIKITESNNDCLDISLGKHSFNNLYLSECGDKGLSVGENSKVDIKDLKIFNSDIGVAAKDSSTLKIENSKVKKVNDCYSAYNKKQEFSGAKISIIKSKCENFQNKVYKDPFSLINISTTY